MEQQSTRTDDAPVNRLTKITQAATAAILILAVGPIAAGIVMLSTTDDLDRQLEDLQPNPENIQRAQLEDIRAGNAHRFEAARQTKAVMQQMIEDRVETPLHVRVNEGDGNAMARLLAHDIKRSGGIAERRGTYLQAVVPTSYLPCLAAFGEYRTPDADTPTTPRYREIAQHAASPERRCPTGDTESITDPHRVSIKVSEKPVGQISNGQQRSEGALLIAIGCGLIFMFGKSLASRSRNSRPNTEPASTQRPRTCQP